MAERLGYSKTLVSMVLNGKAKEYRINEDVCRKVIKLAKELNYQPNQIAKGLRTGKTNTIGLIIADIANPFFGVLGREIENESSKQGYNMMFCSSDENAENSKLQIEMLQRSQVDGFIICPPAGSEEQILALKKSKTPFVLIDRYFPEIESSYVVVDNFQASYEATLHLIKNGFRNVACVTICGDLININHRLEGYKRALIDSNISVSEELIQKVCFSHSKDEVMVGVKKLVLNEKVRVDAILFATSKVGIMGLECIHSLGLKIPEDVAFVSFDDTDAYRISNPPITAIAQPIKEIGSQSVKILMDLMNTQMSNSHQKITLKTNFIIRKSSAN